MCRETLVAVLEYRVLGARRVRLPMALDGSYARAERRMQSLRKQSRTFRIPHPNLWLHLFDLSPIGFDIRLHAHPLTVAQVFLLEQYRCRRAGVPGPGSLFGGVAIDGGGCYGDTALYFASLVGAAGRVLSVEFSPGNIEHFNRNLQLNPLLAPRVEIVPHPLWDVAGEAMSMEHAGSGTQAKLSSHGAFLTTTIDEIASSRELNRLDIIKLDIEGAELAACAAPRLR